MYSSIHLDLTSHVRLQKHNGLRAEAILTLDDQWNIFLTKQHLKDIKNQIEKHLAGMVEEVQSFSEHGGHSHAQKPHAHHELHHEEHGNHAVHSHEHPHGEHGEHKKEEHHGH